jgi:hypothetical protein
MLLYMKYELPLVIAVTLVAFSLPAFGQDNTTDQAHSEEGADATVYAPCTSGIVPDLTAVYVEVQDQFGSKISKSGQEFRFRLAAPIVLGDCEAIPAGTPGMGEVVHAKKATGMGAAGEFVAAARYLQVGERRLGLRSLKLVLTGGDRVGWSTMQSQIGILSYAFMDVDTKNPNVTVEPGTIVMAKTSEAFDVALPVGEDDGVREPLDGVVSGDVP